MRLVWYIDTRHGGGDISSALKIPEILVTKVSVIVPNYNKGPYLDKRLSSILSQTYSDFELLFLDDASTDDSLEVFRRYSSDPRVRAIFNESNTGNVFKQWNKGFAEAKGEYIWIAEADDYADIHFLEILVGGLENHPNAGLACCRPMAVDAQDHLLGPVDCYHHWRQRNGKDVVEDYFNSGRDECANYMVIHNTIQNASGVVFRRSALEKAGYADERYRLAGDWLFWVNILLVGDMVFFADTLNYWRTDQHTVRSSSEKNGLAIAESYNVVRRIIDVVDVDPDTLEESCAFWWYRWSTANKKHHFSIACNLEIYRAAKQVDKRINARILWHRFGRIRPALGRIKAFLLKIRRNLRFS